jgi:hypothetical protein
MGRTVESRPTLAFVQHWLEALLVAIVVIVVACVLVRIALPTVTVFVAQHLLLLITIGVVIVLGGTAPWTVPALWRARRAYKLDKQDTAYHEAQMKIFAATTQQITAGYNVEIINGRSNDKIKIDNPFVSTRGAVTIEQVENLLEQKLLVGGALDAANQIVIPKDFSQTLESFRPTEEKIFLSYTQTGEGIYVPLKSLCHVGLVGATGNGKTTFLRMLISQMQYVQAITYMCDPHFTPFDLESGEDWRPIADRLAVNTITNNNQPITDYAAIKEFLRWYAMVEMPRRLELRRQVRPWGAPVFAAFPEWPAIADAVPEAPAYLALILRQGRKVGVNVLVDTQDLLQQTFAPQQQRAGAKKKVSVIEMATGAIEEEAIPNSPAGAVRKCFRTGIYVGGDQASAKIILDVKNRVEDEKLRLGKGKVMLRCATLAEATQAHAPYPTNESIYKLLPYSSTQTAYPAINAHVEQPYRVRDSFYGATMVPASTVPITPFDLDDDGMNDFPTDENISISEHGEPYFSTVNTGQLVSNADWLDKQVPTLPNLPGMFPDNEESGQSGKPKEYLISEVEKPILINLYNKFHSIEECLKIMKKGARYHKDASRILKDVGLL